MCRKCIGSSGHLPQAICSDKGANIEARDNLGDTPLTLATRAGRTEVVKPLREKGAQ
jgi:ankyrin repeat protein